MKFVVYDIRGDALLEFKNSVDVFKMFGDLSDSFDYTIKNYCDGTAHFAECKGTRQDLSYLRSHTCWVITDIVEDKKPMEIYVVCNSNGDYKAFTDGRAAIDAAAMKNSKIKGPDQDPYHIRRMEVDESTRDDLTNCQPNYYIAIEVNHDRHEILIADTAPTYSKCSKLQFSGSWTSCKAVFKGTVPSLDEDWLRYTLEQIFNRYGYSCYSKDYKWTLGVTCEGVC